MTSDLRVAAIVLAGGKGARLGGVRKADLEVGGARLLDRALEAVAGCAPRIVVGYEDLQVPSGVILTREDPPGTGPAAGVAAGMEFIDDADWVFTLACDLPGVAGAVPALLKAARAAGPQVDAIAASTSDRLEWLVSIHRIASLRAAIERLGEGGVVNCSMGRLLGNLEWEQVAVSPSSTHDIDTWEELDAWQRLQQEETI